jgi:hypothetical protein
MQLFQALTSYMRIDLRGRQIAVAEEHLHHSQVRAMIQQVSCESVAQGVR